MYWKVQKVGPKEFVKAYGVHVALVVSVVANSLFVVFYPKKALPQEVKLNVEVFARDVTNHLLDTSYLLCERNVTALTRELAPAVQQLLSKEGVLPRTQQDLRAMTLDMTERKQVCAVRIDDLKVGEANNRGLIPVEVSGVCAMHSASETGDRQFRFQYMVGTINGALVVADWRDLSPAT